MPRKFLGDRIDRNIDAIRPSSLTLTPDDLKYIPPIPQYFEDEDNKVISSGNGEKRLSKRFGGTLILRKRLESVPELFLHDFKKKPHSKFDMTKGKKSKGIRAFKGAVSSQDSTPYLQERKKAVPLPIQGKCQRRPIISKHTLVQPEKNKEHPDHIIERVFVSRPAPVLMPVQTLTPINPISVMQNQTKDSHGRNKYGKSDSEILFDEILSAYESVSTNNSTALNSEIDRIIDICASKQIAEKNKAIQIPQIICPDDMETLFSSTTPEFKPVNFNALNDTISSPEYTTSGGSTYSELWSSEDELPELERTEWSAKKSGMRSSIVSDSTNDEGYCTAAETLPSTISVEDLDIHNELPKTKVTSSNRIFLNKFSLENVKKVTLDPPKIMYITSSDDEINDDDDNGEEDTTLRILQEKIDCIEIASCSSSIYSR